MKYLLLGLVLLTACTESKNTGITVSGNIRNSDDNKVILSSSEGPGQYIAIDSAAMDQGVFELRTILRDTAAYSFTLKPSGIMFSAILENSHITISGDAAEAQRGYLEVDVEGSYNHSLQTEFRSLYTELLAEERHSKLRELNEKYATEKDIDKQWELKDEMEPYQEILGKEYNKLELDFVKKYNDTYAAAMIMPFLHSWVEAEILKDLYESFPLRMKESGLLDKTKEEIEGRERVMPGAQAPDFTLKDKKGNDFVFSSLKGNYILVDFWASWCKPCRESFPHLKKVYSKYKSMGFEVVGVSNDTDHEAWKKAIEDDGTEWIQLVDEFPEKYSPARIATLYAIHFLPTSYLIDRDGKILAKVEGEEGLDNMLLEIFGK